ncbi:type 1 glutamine amidotransferase [Paenibacillus sp. F411]|uniref:Intracellular protease, PfpI family n=1 Tax=Paenibacillus algicola TaxID=2565926 RepID=A0A4P8XHR8_9BACL|nr:MULTISPECIES: type 1 glutamine amidotransferase domain-containing protein [Paenibacillus]MBO2943334.1 type 1 glutamine amidotransferase [Paenibacillus sp. F411]QCT02097.1 intracellular protease, PfpI family [Paenibacillus algicola]
MTEAKKIAFLLANDFEDSEMKNPYEAMIKNGHDNVIISLKENEELTGKQGSVSYQSHLAVKDAQASDYAAVIIPGGKSPSHLMDDKDIQAFVQEADQKGLTISAICHGPQILAAAGLLKGRTLTSYPGIQDEVREAGGQFVDQEVVTDGNLITSRTPEDEPAFIQATLDALGSNAW